MARWIMLLCLLAAQLRAEIRPSFYLEGAMWGATDIVVVSEGDKMDGEVVVTRVLSGSVRVGEVLRYLELGMVEREHDMVYPSRDVFRLSLEDYVLPKVIDGQEIILFLRRENGELVAVDAGYGDARTSAMWVYEDTCYSFGQMLNPGPVVFYQEVGKSEFLRMLDSVLADKQALDGLTGAEVDLSERMRPYLLKGGGASGYAIAAAGRMGISGFVVLEEMLVVDSFDMRLRVLVSLFDISEVRAMEVYGRLLGAHAEIWEKAAPSLKLDWWNYKADIPTAEVDKLRDIYMEDLTMVEVLSEFGGVVGCVGAVKRLRAVWMGHKNLRRFPRDLVELCDKILAK